MSGTRNWDSAALANLETRVYEVPLDELGMDVDAVCRGMGYGRVPAPEFVREYVADLLREAPDRLALQAGFRLIPHDLVVLERDAIHVAGILFRTGTIIARGLRKSEDLIAFVATCGPGLDAWLSEAGELADLMPLYLIDAIGSEAVERAADWLEARLRAEAEAEGEGITARYSPGYCDWPVAEQHGFFGLLPTAFCGITLTPSALMQPVKSVSGLMGRGPECRKLAYHCSLCAMEHCFRRNARNV